MINSPLDPAAGVAGLDCRQVIVCMRLVVRTHTHDIREKMTGFEVNGPLRLSWIDGF
jgi:hypothetical protein